MSSNQDLNFQNLAQRENSQSRSHKTILVLGSSPTNEAKLRLDKEVREINESLRRSQHREKFTLQQRLALRPDDLHRALLDFNPQIVHFCGHGSGEDGLVLEDDAGLAQLVPTEALANLLKRFATRGLECVVLNACYSEVQANAIAEHIDYVVGMSSQIGDDAAIKFALGFYDELGAGWSYEDAYNGGCDAIALQGIPEQHTPVFKNFKKKVQLRATNQVDDLVQQVRSRIHNDIQSLHGTMPLWGIDHWVPLGDLFVDVNVLEELSSSRRSELDDLWQDFTTGNSNYRSLDRIGLGKEQQRVSGLSVLERNTNLMVVGKPGSGKTTYLQRIVTECNAGKLQPQRIPVLIKLREFVDDGHQYAYNLEQFLGQLWRLSYADIELVLNQGGALVLLDGLDEVTGEAGKQIAKEIKRFARAYPQVQVVVTCRTQTLPDFFDWKSKRFTCVEVADFNEEQVRAFAVHWFGTVCTDAREGEKQSREFLEKLFQEENKPIRELAITPILLSLTCAVFHQTEKFYSKRSKLYEEGLELLLEKWDERRGIGRYEIHPDFSPEKELELLSYVAVKKFEQQQYVLFEQEELEGYIGEFLGIERRKSREVLQAIASQHGLLIERAQKVWSFSHLTFQEYLVAKWFCDSQKFDVLSTYAIQFHWREVFLLSIEIIDNPKPLLLSIKNVMECLVSNNNTLQRILAWLVEQSSYEIFLCSKVRARGFYLDLLYNYEIDKSLALNSKILSQLTLYMALNELNNDRIDCVFVLEQSLYWSVAYSRIVTLTPILFEKNFCEGMRQLGHAFINIESSCRILVANNLLSIKFYQDLLNLWHRVLSFNHDSKEEFLKWWQNHGGSWTQDLNQTVITYRNLGHNWQLNAEEKELFKQYYYLGKLLITCLNSSSVTSEAKVEIQKLMFLPIIEIEKCQD